MRFSFEKDGKTHEAVVEESPELSITLDGVRLTPRIRKTREGLVVKIGRKRYIISREGDILNVNDRPSDVAVRRIDFAVKPAPVEDVSEEPSRKPSKAPADVGGAVHPPMPGRVVSISVKRGQKLRLGGPLLILEAMKMQNEISSPFSGTVREIRVKPGDLVDITDVLVVIDQS